MRGVRTHNEIGTVRDGIPAQRCNKCALGEKICNQRATAQGDALTTQRGGDDLIIVTEAQ